MWTTQVPCAVKGRSIMPSRHCERRLARWILVSGGKENWRAFLGHMLGAIDQATMCPIRQLRTLLFSRHLLVSLDCQRHSTGQPFLQHHNHYKAHGRSACSWPPDEYCNSFQTSTAFLAFLLAWASPQHAHTFSQLTTCPRLLALTPGCITPKFAFFKNITHDYWLFDRWCFSHAAYQPLPVRLGHWRAKYSAMLLREVG